MSRNLIYRMNRVSRLFQPINVIPKDSQPQHDFPSKSYKLMIDEGIIRQASNGMYNILPLGWRALDKLSTLVDQEMTNIGAQKILLPHLTSRDLWETTGRVHVVGKELFTLLDRHDKEYILSPTHEEAVTHLISSVSPLSTKVLPLRLYQTSSKWRDEMKPRLGFLRGREFIMKDLYTFDKSPDDATETYKHVCQAYDHIFRKIGIPFRKVIGNSGHIGGSLSNEYHYISDIGEDRIVTCSSCNYSANTEVHTTSTCPQCNENLIQNTAVEVAHTFLLGTKYSKPMHATFLSNGKPTPLFMGCYGLGLTRILGTAIEILSTNEELRWPAAFAPYTVCIIPPKDGSKEAEAAKYVDNMYKILEKSGLDIIIDDRTDWTIGKRLHKAKRTGYPYIVVIGRKALQPNPQFEIYFTADSKQLEFNFEDTVEYLQTMVSGQDSIQEKDQLIEQSN